jgi:hypothetical protein
MQGWTTPFFARLGRSFTLELPVMPKTFYKISRGGTSEARRMFLAGAATLGSWLASQAFPADPDPWTLPVAAGSPLADHGITIFILGWRELFLVDTHVVLQKHRRSELPSEVALVGI